MIFDGRFQADFTDKQTRDQFVAHRQATDPDFAAWYEQAKAKELTETSEKFANAFSLVAACVLGVGAIAFVAVLIWRVLAWLIGL